jgi:hypothetical protein
MYNGNPAVLAESLEVIQRTAAVILAALQPPVKDEAAESEPASNVLAEVA